MDTFYRHTSIKHASNICFDGFDQKQKICVKLLDKNRKQAISSA